MKVLVIGKGGREHAIAHGAYRSALVDQVFVAPGNPGMKDIATCVEVSDSNVDALVAFAKKEAIDLTIVGPEATLSLGVVDAFEKEGLKIFGPTKAATQVESSKDFAKNIMMKYNIPTAAYATFNNKEEAVAYVNEKGVPIVIKEDGLKAGKGVTVAYEMKEALDALDIAFDIEGNKVVIEECLVGFEFSLICFVNGTTVVPMQVAQDHKCTYDGDKGPNTGGMGCYSPVKKITNDIIEEAMETIMKPMAKAMVDEGVSFTGFLYGGLMLTENGIKTIEFNARFGDPEAEVIIPRLESDFVDTILKVMNNEEVTLKWSDKVSLGVVLASNGYPASSTKDAVITIDQDSDILLYHMGTAMKNDQLVTAGGRVLIAVALEDTLQQAFDKAYSELGKIHCDKLFHRHDIGKKDM